MHNAYITNMLLEQLQEHMLLVQLLLEQLLQEQLLQEQLLQEHNFGAKSHRSILSWEAGEKFNCNQGQKRCTT